MYCDLVYGISGDTQEKKPTANRKSEICSPTRFARLNRREFYPNYFPYSFHYFPNSGGVFSEFFPVVFYGLRPSVTRMMPTRMRPPKKSMRMMSPVSESTTWMFAAVSFMESKIVCAAMVYVSYVRGDLRVLGGY